MFIEALLFKKKKKRKMPNDQSCHFFSQWGQLKIFVRTLLHVEYFLKTVMYDVIYIYNNIYYIVI